MAITQAICSSAKQELLSGVHNFISSGGDTFKIALYTSSATLSSATTAYSSTNEVVGDGYTAGGGTLVTETGSPFLSGTAAYIDFANFTWSTATISAAGALIYNASKSNKAVLVLNFGGTYSSTAGDFTISFPAATSSTAVLILS